jgi:hypothetical protein
VRGQPALEGGDDDSGGQGRDQPDEQPGKSMPEAHQQSLLAGRSGAGALVEIPADTGQILAVLCQKDPQHPVGRDQPEKPTVGVDHAETALLVEDCLGRRGLLIDPVIDEGRICVHDREYRGVVGSGDQVLDPDHADESLLVEDCDVGNGVEPIASDETLADLTGAFAWPGGGYSLRCVGECGCKWNLVLWSRRVGHAVCVLLR